MPPFARPSWEDAVIVVAAILVFLAVEQPWSGDPADDPPAPAPTPAATAPATPAATPAAARPPTASPSPAPAAPTPSPTPAAQPDPDACDFRDELERVKSAVVQVFAGDSSGTGFHVGGGRYVTAAHVVQDERGRPFGEIRILSAAEDRMMTAEALQAGAFSTEPGVTLRDLAVLSADPVAGALDERAPAGGDGGRDVRAIGYGWSQVDDGLGANPSEWPDPLVVKGSVAALAESGGVSIVQADVNVESGMSGGPLVDECGAAIGVTSFIPTRTGERGQPQQGFAVFISVAELARLQ